MRGSKENAMPDSGAVAVTSEEFISFLKDQGFYKGGQNIEILKWSPGEVEIRMFWQDRMARPGGTVSGPAQFGLADLLMWTLLITVDRDGFNAVTTDMNMHFLRAVGGKDLIGKGRLLRSGRKLAVSEVTIFVEDEEDPICHITGTYAYRRNMK